MSTPSSPIFSQVDGGADSGQRGGALRKIGSFIKSALPYIAPIAARLAATAGNRTALEDEYHQHAESLAQDQLAASREHQGLQNQLARVQLANIRSPEQQATAALTQAGALEDVKNLHAPGKDTTEAGGGVLEDVYDPALRKRVTRPKMMTTEVPNPELVPYAPGAPKPNFVQDWNAGPPPTIPKTVPQESQVRAIQKATHGQPVWDPKTNQYIVPVYDAQQQLTRVQPLPGLPAGQAPMSPEKFAQQKELYDVRGKSFGANRPLDMLTSEGESGYGTLAGGIATDTSGQPYLKGNQSGAAGIAQKRATFLEVDKNIEMMKSAIPTVDRLTVSDRAAIVAGLTPGKNSLTQGIEGIGLGRLNPAARALVDRTRSIRQGVTSLRNVLSSAGVSDMRIGILESEMPNEQDFAGSSSEQFTNKLATFERTYNEILDAYPDIFKRTGTRAPLSKKSAVAPKAQGKWNPVKGIYE